MRENRNACKVYVGKSEGDHLEYPNVGRRLIFSWILNEMGQIGLDCSGLL
jgi:hypothetical protein